MGCPGAGENQVDTFTVSGTVTMDVRGREFEIHALTSESAEEVRAGRMDERVARIEGVGAVEDDR